MGPRPSGWRGPSPVAPRPPRAQAFATQASWGPSYPDWGLGTGSNSSLTWATPQEAPLGQAAWAEQWEGGQSSSPAFWAMQQPQAGWYEPAEQLGLARETESGETEARQLEASFPDNPAFAAAGWQNGQANRSRPPKELCPVCGAYHWLRDCPQFMQMTGTQRKESITSKGRCTRCFGTHQPIDCPSTLRCRTCQKFHHTLLHEAEEPSRANLTHEAEELEQEQMTFTARKGNGSSVEPQKKRKKTRKSLRTAPAKITSEEGRETIVNVLLDDGSTEEMLDECIARRLEAAGYQDLFGLIGVGGETQTYERAVFVRLKVAALDGSFSQWVVLAVLPNLTGGLKVKDWNLHKKNFKHLRDINSQL